MDEKTLFDQFHEALDVEPRPGAYERMRYAFTSHPDARARASAPGHQPVARNLTWLMGAAAVLLAIAIVAGLMVVRLMNSHPLPVVPGPRSQLCVSGPTGPSDRFATVHGYITYSDRSEIWAVDPDRPANRISIGPSNGRTPIAWSRDGSRLLLRTAGTNNFNGDLCVMNADGSQTRLTSDGLTSEGSFSRNAATVVFARQDDGLYLVDAKGGTPMQIAKKYGSWNLESPAWSPDDSRIAYLVYYEFDPKGPSYQIWTVRPDGTDPRQVVDLGSCERGGCTGGLVWSPDGSMLAFDSARGPAPTYPTSSLRPLAIYVVHADGSELHRINDDGSWPSWSPDGSRIAFTRGPDLFTMASDGRDVRQVDGVAVAPPYGWAWNPVAGR